MMRIYQSDKTTPVRTKLALAIAKCIAAGLLGNAHAATINVDNGIVAVGADGQCSIVEAVINANQDSTAGSVDCAAGSGDDILMLPIRSSFQFLAAQSSGNALPVVSSNITIEGQDSTLTGDPLSPSFRMVEIDADGDLTVKDLTITYGSSSASGGAILVSEGRLHMDDANVTNSYAAVNGGGIYNDGGELTMINDSLVTDNSAGMSGGGVWSENGSVALSESTAQRNSAYMDGGGLVNIGGPLTLTSSDVQYNAAGRYGGGIWNDTGTVTLSVASNVLLNNATQGGGGILSQQGVVNIKASHVNENSAPSPTPDSYGGGIWSKDGSLTIGESSSVSLNNATADGGGIMHSGGPISIRNSTVEGNTAIRHGGGVYSIDATFELANSTVGGNTGRYGGGIRAQETKLYLANSELSSNSAREGGGLFATFGTTDIFDSHISSNTVEFVGGGLRLGFSPTTIRESRITQNTANQDGGGLYSLNPFRNYELFVKIYDSSIGENSASYSGGGVHSGALLLDSGVVYNNTAGTVGGGAYGSATIQNSEISNNTAESGGGVAGIPTISGSTVRNNTAILGGGILFGKRTPTLSVASVTETTVRNNSAETGGGVAARRNTPVEMSNATISGNTALVGAGIAKLPVSPYIDEGELTFTHVTLANNQSTAKGVDFHWADASQGTVTIRNSILAGGGNDACVVDGGTLTENINNLIADGSCASGSIGGITGDPLLAMLANNGGPTDTHLPLPGSPIIDAAEDASCLAFDQRGVPRDASECDMGAVEFGEIVFKAGFE